MSRSPLFLAIAWVLACTSILTAGLAIRLAPVEKSFAWPSVEAVPMAANWAGPIALVIAVVAILLLLVLTGAAREGQRARPFAELILFFPILFGFIWMLLPAGPLGIREWIIGGIILVAAAWLARHCPGPIPGPKWKARPVSRIFDIALILFPIALGMGLGHSPDLKASGFSLLLYPVYGFIQLSVFLLIPVTRLRALGVSNANSTLLAAIVFSLVHWPNPLVMLVTLVAMLIWSHQFQSGRPLWQLAIVLGLTATTFSQFLPDDLTKHMRVGPGYVRSEAVMFLANGSGGTIQPDPSQYITQIYPETIGREITAHELGLWLELLNTARRSTWANIFIVSDEYRDLRKIEGKTPPPAPEDHWTTWPPEWRKMVIEWGSDDYWVSCGGTKEGFVQSLYQHLLGRTGSDEAVAQWSSKLSIGQRKRVAEVLLEYRLHYGQQDFSGMSVEEFRLSN